MRGEHTLASLDAALVEDAFTFLDDLRESGVTNMFGATPYLVEEFGISREAAGPILTAWMASFNRETTPEERARAAISRALGQGGEE